ncbi:succinate dehydrogenase / fumarate reductase iron-sulfur subunit [Desulfitispora alkaliphila]|uniref:2Fe-2S iron-sulfur cluster-binding protein n=1 Tax=Desulfitispora alkaliphila TaxID=622674 RepID=UPI003D1A5575
MDEKVTLKIKRQQHSSKAHWEKFELPKEKGKSIVVCLQEIRDNPVTIDGKVTTPVIWECNCLEEMCGACIMMINGTPKQACSTLIDNIEGEEVIIEPLSKFPVITDLKVDRSSIYNSNYLINGWIETENNTENPVYDQCFKQLSDEVTQCISCGACYEVCPNYSSKAEFVGPALLPQLNRLINHPLGKPQKVARLKKVAGNGKIQCDSSKNCTEVCPKGIGITNYIMELKKELRNI